MGIFLFAAISLLITGLAWRRILSSRYSWLVRLMYLILTLAPIAGPVFYMMIEPPESTPVAVQPEDFWEPTKGAARPWPSYDRLIRSLSKLFRRLR